MTDSTSSTTMIKTGSRAVVITRQDDLVWANFYVNVRVGADGRESDPAAVARNLTGASITLSRWQGKTVPGAERWAARKLAA